MRFSIRELMLLTLVAALSVGWLLDHWRLQDSASRARFVLLLLYDAVYDAGFRVNDAASIDQELTSLGLRPPVDFSKGMTLWKIESPNPSAPALKTPSE